MILLNVFQHISLGKVLSIYLIGKMLKSIPPSFPRRDVKNENLWLKGIQFYSNKGSCPFPREDNYMIAKIHER